MENNEQYGEISLIDLLIIFANGKKAIALTTLLFALLGFAFVTLSKPVLYQSNLQALAIMPNVISNDSVAVSVSNNVLNGIISSNAVKDAMIDRFKLNEDAKTDKRESIYKYIDKNVKTTSDDKTGVVTLSVTSKSPEKAQQMADFVYVCTDKKLKEMTRSAIALSAEVDAAKLEDVISDKAADDKTQSATILKIYDVLVAKEASSKMRDKKPIGLQLLSPASLPGEPAPRGRAKTLVLFTMLGFFLGIVIAFMKYVWSTVEPEKKAELKAAFGKK